LSDIGFNQMTAAIRDAMNKTAHIPIHPVLPAPS
jgi:hypothetical protein